MILNRLKRKKISKIQMKRNLLKSKKRLIFFASVLSVKQSEKRTLSSDYFFPPRIASAALFLVRSV